VKGSHYNLHPVVLDDDRFVYRNLVYRKWALSPHVIVGNNILPEKDESGWFGFISLDKCWMKSQGEKIWNGPVSNRT